MQSILEDKGKEYQRLWQQLPMKFQEFPARQPNKQEMSPPQEAFAKALFRISQTNDIEEVRRKDWHLDGEYSTMEEDRDTRSTNYLVFRENGQRSEADDQVPRRCTICHQPLKYVNLIGIEGQAVQMGSDCTAKLQRFLETGEIVAENPFRETWKKQGGTLLDAAGYSESEGGEQRSPVTTRRIIASMMTWLTDHASDNGMPENIRYAIRCHNKIGLLPNNDLARALGEYYKKERKFLPAEILNSNEFQELMHHPHRRMLHKIIDEGLVQDDIPQLKRVVLRGAERRIALEEKRKHDEERQRQGQLKLEDLHRKGVIEKLTFRHIGFIDGVRISSGDHPISYEVDNDGAIHVFELDQTKIQRAYSIFKATNDEYFVCIGDPNKIDHEKSAPPTEFRLRGRTHIIKRSILQTALHYSCAQVIVDKQGEIVVMLKNGPVFLAQFLKECEAKDIQQPT